MATNKKNINSDLLVGVCSLVVAIVFYSYTRGLSKLGAIFVNYVLVILGALSVMTIIKGFIKPERIAFFESAIERNNIMAGLSILIVYLALMPFIGFLPSSYLFFLVMNLYLAEGKRFSTRNIVISVIMSVLVVTAFYLIFRYVLLVPLPEGSLFDTDI